MLKLLDRQMYLSYLKSYFVCMVSLLGLFIVVDLFTNLEDFMRVGKTMANTIKYVATYYTYNTAKNFDQISEAIVLLAAMFTVALMQRNNELLPLLSAGVSTRRVVLPALMGALSMLGLSVANQELILPHIDAFMVENKGDPHGERESEVTGGYDPLGIHITGGRAIKKTKTILDFHCLLRPRTGQQYVIFLQAKEAHFIPLEPNNRRTGGWLLSGTKTNPAELPQSQSDNILEQIESDQFFLRTPDLSYERVTRLKNWQVYTPTWKLLEELRRIDSNTGSQKLAAVAVLFHMRFTRPILGMVLVILGLSVILSDQNRNVFVSAAFCLGLCAVFFITCFACQSLGNYEYLEPKVAAWLPVMLFGPLAAAMFLDAIHT